MGRSPHTSTVIVLTLVTIFSVFNAPMGELMARCLRFRVELSPADVVVELDGARHRISFPGALPSGMPGHPELPELECCWVIPPDMTAADVHVVETEWVTVAEHVTVAPAQPPRILSLPGSPGEGIRPVSPDREIYASDDPYPERIIDGWHSGSMRGYRILSCTYFPLRYRPLSKRLECLSGMTVEVALERLEGGLSRSASPRFPGSAGLCVRNILESRISNPENLDTFGPVFREAPLYPRSGYDYIIITHADYTDEFQPLADWRHRHGLPAAIYTVGAITADYPGRDAQEKIRNFIIDAYESWGTGWVLLGGDTDVVPARTAWAMDCEAGITEDENEIRCDLYYADLDGDWDGNGNDNFGEVEDGVDLYPDLFIGRASVDSEAEASAWVAKVLTYETDPPMDYQTDMLFLGEVFWFDPYTDAGVGKDMIDDLYVPPRFDPIMKLYQSLGNEDYATVMEALNEGKHIVNHAGHAWTYVMSVGYGSLVSSDMDNLVNGPRYSIWYSLGCWPAAFDYDCIAEHCITAENGGGVAFIGNNRYGWGSPGNPGYGYSDIFDKEFFKQLLVDEVNRIGAAIDLAKAVYIPYSLGENVYRWHQYQLNLLGDPAMPVWTDVPRSLAVSAPEKVPMGSSSFTVTVTDDLGPVEGALACLLQEGEAYHRGWTGSLGQVTFRLNVRDAARMRLTATAPNHLYAEKMIEVQPDGPWCAAGTVRLDDAGGGDGDGLPGPGETLNLTIPLINRGSDEATDVSAVLRISDDMYITLIDSVCQYGSIPPADSLDGEPPYVIEISPSCPEGHVAMMVLHSSLGGVAAWKDDIALAVCIPSLAVRGCVFDDGENGIPEPNETGYLEVTLENTGNGFARDVFMTLSSLTSHVEVLSSESSCEEIPPDSTGTGSPSFEIRIDSEAPVPCFPGLEIAASLDGGGSFIDTLILPIGPVGFADGAEEGEGAWTHDGNFDNWHISEHRRHDGSRSWYCGIEDRWDYPNYMNASLNAPQMATAPDFYFAFWHWYEVTIYGVDGFYVEISLDYQDWETVDFIGSGGALDEILPLGGYWVEQRYEFPDIPPGTPAAVRFRFASDSNDTEEGLYLDDFYFHGCLINEPSGITNGGDEERNAAPVPPARSCIAGICPNPFNPRTTIRYDVAGKSSRSYPVRISVFNVRGESVADLVDTHNFPGRYSTVWNGRGDDGRTVPSGVYLCVLNVGNRRHTGKFLLLK